MGKTTEEGKSYNTILLYILISLGIEALALPKVNSIVRLRPKIDVQIRYRNFVVLFYYTANLCLCNDQSGVLGHKMFCIKLYAQYTVVTFQAIL